jgi:hypothetical protein
MEMSNYFLIASDRSDVLVLGPDVFLSTRLEEVNLTFNFCLSSSCLTLSLLFNILIIDNQAPLSSRRVSEFTLTKVDNELPKGSYVGEVLSSITLTPGKP